MLTWEETILSLRGKQEFNEILFNSYLNDDPVGNVERFIESKEFQETLQMIRKFFPNAKKILEIGSGTGMSAISLTLSGYEVTATDPDRSEVVGCGAITKLKLHYQLQNIQIIQAPGESLPFENETFDLIYVRQALHHAANLFQFVKEACRVLKPKGGFLAIREHVIFNKRDKETFLQSHPLHGFYGQENAFQLEEYTEAIKGAGLKLDKVLRYFDSPINYFPLSNPDRREMNHALNTKLNLICVEKFGPIGNSKLVQNLYRSINVLRFGAADDERRIPGRMYSFIAHKN